MTTELSGRVDEILALRTGPRIEPLIAIAEEVATEGGDDKVIERIREGLLSLIDNYAGNGRQRLEIGLALSKLGDPRLRTPADADYWTTVEMEDGSTLHVAVFPVTTREFKAWVTSGGYQDDQHWSAEGLAWRNSGASTWGELAESPDVSHLVVDNQPVAGPTWWEAEAYANAHQARLLTSGERRFVVRGAEKRPYPWGEPFGDSNANTREEALNRPCAVGLYAADRTPDGVRDMAGNMAEWLADLVGTERALHPGCWRQPSMAAWAKAVDFAKPDVRSGELSFRLARSG